MPHMYMLRCADGSFYVGSTVQLEARVVQHNEGAGAAYTRRRRPVELVFAQEFDRIEDAYAMEKRVQNWSRAKRQALVDGGWDALPELSRKRWPRLQKPARDEPGLETRPAPPPPLIE